jgi:hypothetical protein
MYALCLFACSSLEARTQDSEHVQVARPARGLLSKFYRCSLFHRAATQKLFNEHILPEYRAEQLAQYRFEHFGITREEWEQLGADARKALAPVNSLYCAMHLGIGFTEGLVKAIKLFEDCCYESPQTDLDSLIGEAGQSEAGQSEAGGKEADKKGEPRVCALVRPACKALHKRGSEQAGVPEHFKTHCARQGLEPDLVAFKGHRYLALYKNAAELLRLRGAILDFLDAPADGDKSVWQLVHGGPLNKLLLAVRDGFRDPLMLAGLKNLGLLGKQAAGRMMIAFKSEGHVLEANFRYLEMREKFNGWSVTSAEFLVGAEKLFVDIEDKEEDKTLEALLEFREQDGVVLQMLELSFSVWKVVLENMARDQLPGGKFDGVGPGQRATLASVKKENDVSEREFATLDRLMREKPNFLFMALEGMILYHNNRVGKWLGEKQEQEKAKLVAASMKLKLELKGLYAARKAEIRVRADEKLREAQEKEAARKAKLVELKEAISKRVMALGGLWEGVEDMEKALGALSIAEEGEGLTARAAERKQKQLETAKLEAVKDQLRYRQTVFGQSAKVDTVFKDFGLDVMKGKLLAFMAAVRRAAEEPPAQERRVRTEEERREAVRKHQEKLAAAAVPIVVQEQRAREKAKTEKAVASLRKCFKEVAAHLRQRQARQKKVAAAYAKVLLELRGRWAPAPGVEKPAAGPRQPLKKCPKCKKSVRSKACVSKLCKACCAKGLLQCKAHKVSGVPPVQSSASIPGPKASVQEFVSYSSNSIWSPGAQLGLRLMIQWIM